MTRSLMEKAVAFHGHACPGLAIGVRVCEAVMTHPEFKAAEYGKLVCVTENDACGVDAVQCLLGCSVGKANLIFHETGKQAFSFFDRDSKKSLRLYLAYRQPEGCSREEWQELLLTLPTTELFTVGKPAVTVPERARIFATVRCELCGEGAAEHKIRLQDGKRVCLSCFAAYRGGWSGL